MPARFTDEQILKGIRRFQRQNKRIPTANDFGKGRDEGYPSAGTVAQRFGSWAEGVFQATGKRPRRGRPASA